MKTMNYLLLVVLPVGWFTGCTSHEANVNTKTKQKICVTDSLEKIIRIDTASLDNVDNELKLSGEISFNENKVVKIFPFSSGKVLEVRVTLGDKVSKGETLAIIKSADVAGNYSDLSTSQNDVVISKKQLDNTESLYKNGIASEREYIEAKENYNKALSIFHKIEKQIAINGGGHTSDNGTYIITAPINGYVVEKKINQGGFIRNDNTDNLFTIGDVRDVWVLANVYETDIAKVKEGYEANITTLAYPGKIFTGIVDKINKVLDPVTKVMKIRIKLSNDSLLLKPEMFANILIKNRESQKSVVIPEEALINDNGKNFVVIFHDKCEMEIRQVQVIKSTAGRAYISSGVLKGEKVISKNQILLFRALTS